MERRQRARVKLKMQCRVGSPANRFRDLWKETEDISRTGMLIRWNLDESDMPLPHVGDDLVIEVKLPVNPFFGQRWMHYKATVVRVSKDGSRYLIAVKAKKSRFRTQTRHSVVAELAGYKYVN